MRTELEFFTRLTSKVNGLLSLVAVCLIFLAGCEGGGHRRPTRTYVPKGYEGWVRIEYGVAVAPELPREWRVIPPMSWNRELVPQSGLLQTSSAYGSGANSSHEFYFYSEGSTTAIPNEMIHCEFTFHNFSFREEKGDQKEFVTLFIGKPTAESAKHCEDILKYKTPTLPYFKMNRWSDLPPPGNLNTTLPK